MLRNRSFLNLWLVNIAITLAMELFAVTILVVVFEQTDSTLQAAGVMVSRTLAAFLLGPFAGVLVDRFPRKYVLMSMDLIRVGLVALVIWMLRVNDTVPIMGIYLISAGLSAAGVFHRPARLALIPSLVPQNELVRANSFILASNQIMTAVSYTVGGWLILSVPLRPIAIGILLLYLIGVMAAFLITVPKRAETDQPAKKETLWRSMLSGWRYLNNHALARPLTIMETIEHVPHGIWTGALMLAFTIQALDGDAVGWGYQVTGYFSGMIVGSLGVLSINKWLQRYPGWIIILNASASGVLTLLFASSPTVVVATMLAFVFGPPGAVRDVAQDSLLQGTVSGAQLGRVYATREMLRSIVFMFSGLFFAWLSDLVPIRMIYYLGGVFYLLTGVYALSIKSLRNSRIEPIGDPEPLG